MAPKLLVATCPQASLCHPGRSRHLVTRNPEDASTLRRCIWKCCPTIQIFTFPSVNPARSPKLAASHSITSQAAALNIWHHCSPGTSLKCRRVSGSVPILCGSKQRPGKCQQRKSGNEVSVINVDKTTQMAGAEATHETQLRTLVERTS